MAGEHREIVVEGGKEGWGGIGEGIILKYFSSKTEMVVDTPRRG